jgi:hypothetical protein
VSNGEFVLVSADPVSQTTPLDVGTAMARSTANFTKASLSGVSAFAAEGLSQMNQVNQSTGVAGLFNADGAGNATGSLDESSGGNSTHQMFSGDYSVEPNGRVTLTNFGPTPPVLYMVSPNQAYLIGTDNSVTMGSVQPQTGAPFTNASYNGAYVGSSGEQVIVGSNYTVLSSANGVGNVSFTINTDTLQTQIASGTYSVDTTGRAIVATNGSQIGVAYIVSPSKVILLVPGLAGPVLTLEK